LNFVPSEAEFLVCLSLIVKCRRQPVIFPLRNRLVKLISVCLFKLTIPHAELARADFSRAKLLNVLPEEQVFDN
jgi:hypothetical protein